jgi:hypothetical protein
MTKMRLVCALSLMLFCLRGTCQCNDKPPIDGVYSRTFTLTLKLTDTLVKYNDTSYVLLSNPDTDNKAYLVLPYLSTGDYISFFTKTQKPACIAHISESRSSVTRFYISGLVHDHEETIICGSDTIQEEIGYYEEGPVKRMYKSSKDTVTWTMFLCNGDTMRHDMAVFKSAVIIYHDYWFYDDDFYKRRTLLQWEGEQYVLYSWKENLLLSRRTLKSEDDINSFFWRAVWMR